MISCACCFKTFSDERYIEVVVIREVPQMRARKPKIKAQRIENLIITPLSR
jgi:hypothetical protein